MAIINWKILENYLKLKNLEPKTLLGYRNNFRILADFVNNNLTEESCDKFFFHLQKNYSSNTCHIFVSLLRHIGRCYNLEFIKKYHYPKRKKRYIEVLTPNEIKKLAETYTPRIRDYRKNNYRFKVAIYTLGTTGIRISELCNLRWADVSDDRIIIRSSKTGEYRIVPILQSIYKMINKLPRDKNDYVFGHRGGKLAEGTILKELKERAKLAGIKKRVYNHLFRHSWITEMSKKGENPFKIAKIVGHKDVKTTLEYTHLVIDDLFEVVKKHPLAQDKINFNMIKLKIKKFLEGIQPNKFEIDFKEVENEIVLRIIKN